MSEKTSQIWVYYYRNLNVNNSAINEKNNYSSDKNAKSRYKNETDKNVHFK